MKNQYYETQSKFVHRNHPFGDDARFRAGLPSLEDIKHALREGCANQGSFDTLVHLNVDEEEIYHLLRMIGVSSDTPIQWTRAKRRNARQLADKSKKLAAEIERADKKWPFGTRVIPRDFFEWHEVPRLLRSYANAWEEQLSHPSRSPRSPRNENIIRLLEYVKDKTRRYHYAEVADLLNATDAAYGWETRDGGNRWDATNLREIVKRKGRN